MNLVIYVFLGKGESMAKVTFKGTPIQLKGEFPQVGKKAPAFTLVGQDLQEATLETFKGKKKILNVFVSIDTPVCSKSLHTFQKQAQALPDVVVANISLDLPFAAKRFCSVEKVDGVVTLSAFRSTFGKDYGLEIAEGPLKGLLARAVFVLDKENKILHLELVPEIAQEPNYEAALQSVKK